MLLPPLLDKLNFIRRFYEITSEPFTETKRKIEQHEEPFSRSDIEDEEPPYLVEWLDANESLNILGKACLSLLQDALMKYVSAFVEHYAPSDARVTWDSLTDPTLKKNRILKYKQLFLGRYNIDWEASSIAVDRVEEIILARNGIQHGGNFYNLEHRQGNDYFERFPDSIFADELERELYPAGEAAQPYRITVSKDNLFAAIQSVEEFCTYLDSEWWKANT